MHNGIKFEVLTADQERPERVIKDRNTAQKHVWRASIILLSADGVCTAAIMRQTGKSKTCVWRWQERFMATGVNILNGTVIGRNIQQHRHQEFTRPCIYTAA